MKNLVQQWHLRRVCWRLIVSLTSMKRSGEENEIGRRKNKFSVKGWRKTPRKKTEFQTATIPPLSFRR